MSETLDFEGFELGDLVNFITKNYLDPLTEIKVSTGKSSQTIKQGRKNNFPPTMVIIELAKLNKQEHKLYNETTGQQIKDKIQIKCMWYAKIKGEKRFHERWFNSSVLEKIDKIDNPVKRDCVLSEIVTLRTYLAAEYETRNIIETQREVANSSIENVTYTFETDTSSFFPPKMVVTSIGKTNTENVVYSEKTGKITKWLPSQEIKCMWYEADTGKFSEKHFPIEALLASNEDNHSARIEDFLNQILTANPASELETPIQPEDSSNEDEPKS